MKKKSPKLFNSAPEVISFFTVTFITGLLVSGNFANDKYVIWLITAICLLLLSFIPKFTKIRVISLFTAAIFTGMFYGAVRFVPKTDFSDLMRLDNTSGVLTGRYTGKSKIGKNRIQYIFDNLTYTTNNENIIIPLEVSCSHTPNHIRLFPYQNYKMTGKLKIIDFDKRPVFEAAEFTSIKSKIGSVISISKTIQGKIIHGLTSVLKKEHAAIVIGFILGDTSHITDKAIFSETGISHLLAISGQHIMILLLLAASILHWFKIPPISRVLLIITLLTFYATITVGSPSVWRALIMYAAVSTIMLLESHSSPIRPISIAAFILLLYDPSLIKDAAFILSFTAVISIIFFRQPIEFIISKLKLPKVFTRYLATAFAANIGTSPMVAYLFGSVSLSSYFVNPMVLWSFTFILPVSFFIAFLASVSMPLAILLAPGLSVLLDLMISFLKYVKNIPGLYLQVGNVKPITILAIYTALFAIAFAFNKLMVKKLSAKKTLKPKLINISSRKLPTNEDIKICIDSHSKAMPTFLGKSVNLKELQEKSKSTQPFKIPEIVIAIDEMLCGLKKISTSSPAPTNSSIPVSALTLDGQALYNRLFEIDESIMREEPERLLEAHIYLLAIIGYELLDRINCITCPPLTPDELNVDISIKSPYLAAAILSDIIMNSYLVERLIDQSMEEILVEGHYIYLKAEEHLEKILSDKCFNQCIKEHIALRKELLEWCYDFICRSNNILKPQISNPNTNNPSVGNPNEA